jgi:ABC-type dipeptide/oligopeptide/nickel transport system ATPase component
MSPLLTVRQARVHLQVGPRLVRAVDGVDLDLMQGECVGILGESGSGKSTLGRMIARLLPGIAIAHLSGEVTFDGQDIARMPDRALRALRRQRSFAMVFQDPLSHLNPTRRIGAQMTEALPPVHDPGRAAALLTQVGLADPGRILRLYPHQLSGGMRQRVLIAMAMAARPRLLIADEPTTALDATVQVQVIQTLRRLHREQGVAMLVISHNLGLVAELCDRVYVMDAGRVVEQAAIEDLFDRPSHPVTAGLVAAARRLSQPAWATP